MICVRLNFVCPRHGIALSDYSLGHSLALRLTGENRSLKLYCGVTTVSLVLPSGFTLNKIGRWEMTGIPAVGGRHVGTCNRMIRPSSTRKDDLDSSQRPLAQFTKDEGAQTTTRSLAFATLPSLLAGGRFLLDGDFAISTRPIRGNIYLWNIGGHLHIFNNPKALVRSDPDCRACLHNHIRGSLR